MVHNVVDCVFEIIFHTFFGAFGVIANRFVLDFVSRSSDTPRGPSLSITGTYGPICRGKFSRQALWVLGLV